MWFAPAVIVIAWALLAYLSVPRTRGREQYLRFIRSRSGWILAGFGRRTHSDQFYHRVAVFFLALLAVSWTVFGALSAAGVTH